MLERETQWPVKFVGGTAAEMTAGLSYPVLLETIARGRLRISPAQLEEHIREERLHVVGHWEGKLSRNLSAKASRRFFLEDEVDALANGVPFQGVIPEQPLTITMVLRYRGENARVLTVEQAALALGLTPKTVLWMMARGKLQPFATSYCYTVRATEVEDLLRMRGG